MLCRLPCGVLLPQTTVWPALLKTVGSGGHQSQPDQPRWLVGHAAEDWGTGGRCCGRPAIFWGRRHGDRVPHAMCVHPKRSDCCGGSSTAGGIHADSPPPVHPVILSHDAWPSGAPWGSGCRHNWDSGCTHSVPFGGGSPPLVEKGGGGGCICVCGGGWTGASRSGPPHRLCLWTQFPRLRLAERGLAFRAMHPLFLKA